MVGCIVQPITDSKICVESLKMMIIMTVIYFGCVNLNEVKKEKTEPETLNQACHFWVPHPLDISHFRHSITVVWWFGHISLSFRRKSTTTATNNKWDMNTNVRNESDYVMLSLLTSCKFIMNSHQNIFYTLCFLFVSLSFHSIRVFSLALSLFCSLSHFGFLSHLIWLVPIICSLHRSSALSSLITHDFMLKSSRLPYIFYRRIILSSVSRHKWPIWKMESIQKRWKKMYTISRKVS